MENHMNYKQVSELHKSPVTIGYHNLTDLQKRMLEDQGCFEDEFENPSSELFWEVGEFILFKSQDLQEIQPMSVLYDTEWEYFYREGVRNYALRFEKNNERTFAVYCEVANLK